MTSCIKEPILLPSKNFVDERGYLIKPSLYLPSSEMQFIFKDVYISSSSKNVFRGLHYQDTPYQQEKLFTPLSGLYTIFCINIEDHSLILQFTLSPSDSKSLYVPKGWATGLFASHDQNSILFCSPQSYCASAEKGISYSAIPALNALKPILSLKDQAW